MIKNLDIRAMERIRVRLGHLYGSGRADLLLERMAALIGRYGVGLDGYGRSARWDQSTAVLIAYGDMVRRDGEPPLRALKRFADRHLAGAVNTIHLLPFFPWSSDDGFSVMDYRAVDPALGRWADVQELGRGFRLMFDLVLNHCSRKGRWFSSYVANIAPYRDYFIAADPQADLSAVVRPRALPLLTPVQTRHGDVHLWTTFSDDQVDLDFSNPDVLFEFLDLLLFYIANGATLIRLDAVAYLWKRVGTPCIHLEETHEVVKLMRDLLGMVAPDAALLTETNVPHHENIAYFGTGDEAHMVYQFSLPPLLLHALLAGDASHLTQWAAALEAPPPGCTFFNFTASHDGIGLRPLQGLVPDDAVARLAARMQELGGLVSFKANPGGGESPYELNIAWFDALADDPAAVTARHLDRFLCSQTVAMELRGVPGFYFNSLVAARNDLDGVARTGRARSINRRKWQEEELEAALADPASPVAKAMGELLRRLHLRGLRKAFHPDAGQRVLDLGPSLFAIEREGEGDAVTCISNVADTPVELEIDDRFPGLAAAGSCTDLLSGRRHMGRRKVVVLDPCQTVWLHD